MLNTSKDYAVSLKIQVYISPLFTQSLIIKQFYFKQFNLAFVSIECKCQTDLFDPKIRPNQVLPLRPEWT